MAWTCAISTEAAATPLFGKQTYAAQVDKATGWALRMFGVRYVTTRTDWLPIDTASARPKHALSITPYLELARSADDSSTTPDVEVDGEGARQIITPKIDGLSGIVVHFRPTEAAMSTRMTIALRDAAAISSRKHGNGS